MEALPIEEARALHRRFHGAIKVLVNNKELQPVSFEQCWSRSCVQARAAFQHQPQPWYERAWVWLQEWLE